MAALQRTLGLPALVFLGVGVIVGAGIYSVIGAAAGAAGGLLWLAFAVAAVPAALAALNYAELVALLPKIGGEYAFLREAFPRHRWVSSGPASSWRSPTRRRAPRSRSRSPAPSSASWPFRPASPRRRSSCSARR